MSLFTPSTERRVVQLLESIDRSFVRIADALDRAYPSPRESPADAIDPPEISLPIDYARAADIERRLRDRLGRDPYPEEILRQLDLEDRPRDARG